MTARILLIRHAPHGQLGEVLSGRTPELALTPEGRRQAARLAARLAHEPIVRVQASPLQRAVETAEIIAAPHGQVRVELCPALDEVDFGEWAGRAFAELSSDPQWDEWNSARSQARAPGGETMAEAQDRIWAHIVHIALEHPGETLALVTHCDLIRAAIARVLGLSLDRLLDFEVSPASVSRIEVGEWGAKVLSLNEYADA